MTGAFRPVDRDALAAHLADRAATTTGRLRLIVDGPPPAAPVELGRAVAARLRAGGRDAIAVDDFLRPASVRLELGRTDPDMFLDGWLDEPALRREVLDPMGPDGSGAVLPRLRDTRRDRAFRDEPVPLGATGVVVLTGGRLLGRGLPAELTVHLRMTRGALGRRLDPDLAWTAPAWARYETEGDPGAYAEVLVMSDHPDRPALRDQ
ncbi:uridine kinase [Pseudonocardia sp. HH130630-07]|uniref:uridine kinase n=1 Tax=Pseudonocardia sp. HH130630-07 TaxID=1690815 RepID=UPI000814D514|nr:uridine kinase [Pseudonocardia sp. HH130630-07]ANY06716.1 uridine kinase [Pseudonocardia sp. HH130630-07]